MLRSSLSIERGEERLQQREFARGAGALLFDVGSAPVVKTAPRIESRLAARDHRLQHRIGDSGVKQRRDDGSLRIGVNLEATQVLLPDESVEAHARSQ